MRLPPSFVTFMVRPEFRDPSVAHLLRAHSDPLLVLNTTHQVRSPHCLFLWPMNTLTIWNHVLMWDDTAVHTLP